MKTYMHESGGKFTRYFYDTAIRSWTVYEIDAHGNQTGEAEYYAHIQNLRKGRPEFKMKIEPEIIGLKFLHVYHEAANKMMWQWEINGVVSEDLYSMKREAQAAAADWARSQKKDHNDNEIILHV